MANERIEIIGAEKLLSQLRLLGETAGRAAGKGLYRGCEKVMTRSKEEYCPVDLGALRSTGHVDPPEIHGSGATVKLGYGGPSGVMTRDGKGYVGYALYVHENTSARHVVGQAKYLETPLREDAPKIAQEVVDSLNELMGGL